MKYICRFSTHRLHHGLNEFFAGEGRAFAGAVGPFRALHHAHFRSGHVHGVERGAKLRGRHGFDLGDTMKEYWQMFVCVSADVCNLCKMRMGQGTKEGKHHENETQGKSIGRPKKIFNVKKHGL